MSEAQRRNLIAYVDENLQASSRLLLAGNLVGAAQTMGEALKSLSRLMA